MEETTIQFTEAATLKAKELLTAALEELKKTVNSNDGDKLPEFFPDGIHLISINVAVANVKVDLKVAGSKPASEVVG